MVWPRDHGTYASRYENGHWKKTVRVAPEPLGLNVFAAQSLDAQGSLLVSVSEVDLDTHDGLLLVLKYLVSSGWTLDTAASWANGTTLTRTAAAWLGTAGGAVGIFNLAPFSEEDYHALSSTVFDGTNWSAPNATR